MPDGTHGENVMKLNTRVMEKELPGETELNAPPTSPIVDYAGGTPLRAIGSAPECTPEQGRLLHQQEPSPTMIGEKTRGIVSDAHWSKHRIAVLHAPEGEPSGESSDKWAWFKTSTPEVREGRRRVRRDCPSGGTACLACGGWQSRLRRRTTPRQTRVKEKDKETKSWKLGLDG